MPDDLNDPDSSGLTDPIVREAHQRWKRCAAWESTARNNASEDYKFILGDEYNHWQWPVEVQSVRQNKPNLTINEAANHCNHIINDAMQNKSEVRYRATGDGATYDAAEVYEGLYRHIANLSNAQMQQGQAIAFQVNAGFGYTIIRADYVEASPKPGADAFNQEIKICGVDDPWTVMLDCDSRELDGSDSRYGFEFTDRPNELLEEQYPELKGKLGVSNAIDGDDAGWMREKHTRECIYYRVSEDRDELLGDDDGNTVFASKVPAELEKQWEEEHEARGSRLKRRPIIRKSLKAHHIIGDMLIESRDLPGTSVPIVPWYGQVTLVNQVMDRRSHTRTMLSAQRMLNYFFSSAVEHTALQTKAPWLAPMAAIEDYISYYSDANIQNYGVLPYNHRDEEGNEIPAPERQQPPASAPAYVEGVQQSQMFMQTTSGQYQATLGDNAQEKSGRAINERQRAGERATYHFVNSQALAIRRQGQIIKEWIPEIYDTARVAKIIGIDGEEAEIKIDPDAPLAHHVKGMGDAIQRIFNPRIGNYEVVVDVGPDYATQRQEAFDAMVQIIKEAPELVAKIGDLLFKVADFPLADEIAERLKPGMDPQAQAAINELQQQLAKGNKSLGEMMQLLSEQSIKIKQKESKSVVDEFNADTDRAKMLLDAATKVDPAAAMEMIRQMAQEAVHQAMQDNLGAVRDVNNGGLAVQAHPASGDGPGVAPAHLPSARQSAGVSTSMVNE